VRRNKLAVAATGAEMLALILGVAASTWRFVLEKHTLEMALAAVLDAEQARMKEAALHEQAETAKTLAVVELAVARKQFSEAERLLGQVPLWLRAAAE
jgi:hypothetical protein